MEKTDCMNDIDDFEALLSEFPDLSEKQTKEEKLLKFSNEELEKRLHVCKGCTYQNVLHCIKRLRYKMDALNGRKERFCDRPKLKICSGYAKSNLLVSGKCRYYKSCAEAEVQFAALGIK